MRRMKLPQPAIEPAVLLDTLGTTVGLACRHLDLNLNVAVTEGETLVIHDPLHQLRDYEYEVREFLLELAREDVVDRLTVQLTLWLLYPPFKFKV